MDFPFLKLAVVYKKFNMHVEKKTTFIGHRKRKRRHLVKDLKAHKCIPAAVEPFLKARYLPLVWPATLFLVSLHQKFLLRIFY